MKTKILFFLSATLIFTTCKKSKTSEPDREPTPYYVGLTDAPGPYQAVNVDIQGVEITANGSAVMLNINKGIYDLLKLTNGVDTMIATGSLNVEKIQQIRLILGSNNSVAIGGSVFPLTVPSGSESGLKLQVHQSLQAGVAYYVLLDFDANQSIVENGNGGYHLKPVIRTIESAVSGGIKGQVIPAGVSATATAAGTNGSYSSIVDPNGYFIIKGVPAGTYTVTISPVSPYKQAVVNNITVSNGSTALTGTLGI